MAMHGGAKRKKRKKRGYRVLHGGAKKKRGYRVCSSGYAATDTS
jgi:hypothetical protein